MLSRPPRTPSPGALRKRRSRMREQAGLTVYSITVNENATADALIAAGKLTAEQALDRKKVEQALGALVEQWSARWVSRVPQ